MSKGNKILLGIFSFILVCVVGYALFSDNITVTGTATASGDFAYKIETMKGINNEIKINDMYALVDHYGERISEISTIGNEGNIEDSYITNTENSITFSASIKNQGESQYFTAKITNTGSIPLVFDMYYDFQENATITGNLIMYDGFLLDVNKVFDAIQGGVGSEYVIVQDYANSLLLKDNLTLLYDIFVKEEIYNKLNEEFDNGIDSLPVIETGESIYLLFRSSWPDTVDFSDTVKGIDVSGQNTITLPLRQYIAE